MIIPTLRKTGLILGYENSIRTSANGSIVVESKRISDSLHRRALQALILDIDKTKFGFVAELIDSRGLDKFTSKRRFREMLASKIIGPSFKQKMERIDHWLSILEQAELIRENNSEEIALSALTYKHADADLEISTPKVDKFETYLIDSHNELRREVGVIVDIADLREKVATKLLNNDKEILTEDQFDELLRTTLLTTKKYRVSLGRSMGAEEKLFEYNGKYYRTLTIEFVGGK